MRRASLTSLSGLIGFRMKLKLLAGNSQERLVWAAVIDGRLRRPSEQGRAIKVALERIAEHNPALATLLTKSIRTGTFCSYTSDSRLPTILCDRAASVPRHVAPL